MKPIFTLVGTLTLLAAGSAQAKTPSGFEIMQTVITKLQEKAVTSLPLISITSIEIKGMLKCSPGIHIVQVRAGAAEGSAYRDANLDIEIGGCGSDSVSKDFKLVKEKYY
jgi:hypothetical protein